MKIYIKFLILSVSVITTFSCTEKLLGPEPVNSPTGIFEQLWNDYDKHYSRFIVKGVNWDSLYVEYSSRISDDISNRELFDHLSGLISHLQDAHAILESDFDLYVYNKYVPTNFNLNFIKFNYLSDYKNNAVLTYGQLTSDIGYIHISSFYNQEIYNYTYIDEVLNSLNTSKGIVIDIRGNGGGDTDKAEIIASRFTDIKYVYASFQYRNGPDHSDFSEVVYCYISPVSSNNYKNKTVLLFDKTNASASEDFVCMMDVLPHVATIGTTTMGSEGGCPITRELTNGWRYRMASCVQKTADGNYIEDYGITPDFIVEYTDNDAENNTDPQLEAAIDLLLFN